ncbi:MAG: hypothetical protein JSR58_00005, partial [Verrucomicrobia bacterium]|nr:hypothetical protein [Verrucomicrobiota bacterium]
PVAHGFATQNIAAHFESQTRHTQVCRFLVKKWNFLPMTGLEPALYR